LKREEETIMTDLPWEDNLVERKVNPSMKDIIRTIVAFTNSVKPGQTAKFYIGERDDGTAEGVANPEKTQITVQEACDKIYPPITNTCRSRVYEKDGKPCVCVEIVYDGDTPHFAGKAFVRRGSQTKEASDEVFQKLIELRLGKVRELEKWVGKEITICFETKTIIEERFGVTGKKIKPLSLAPHTTTLLEVNNFWVTILALTEEPLSEPLENITLSWDNEEDRLMLLVKG
jgi:hypothetical protein